MLNNYKKHPSGVIEQVDKQPFVYDVFYVSSRYDNRPNDLSKIRISHIENTIKRKPNSILDIGYGNGSFIRVCLELGISMYGTDVSGYPIPNGATSLSFDKILDYEFDVITMFDSLEHFHSIDFLKKLHTNFLVISVPWCHYLSDEWFINWKHRRPDEHNWHFNAQSLINVMHEMGFVFMSISNIEDAIRIPADTYPNILTGIFKKHEG